MKDFSAKSSIEEIRSRFDRDVERFSNLETGQQTVIDAQYSLQIITDAVRYVTPGAKTLLDIGCGAGNYTVKMLEKIADLNCTLIDLSMPMLQKARERVSEKTKGNVSIIQGNILDVDLPEDKYCVVLAGAVLHHLRSDSDWHTVFQKIFRALKPGGSFWISDLVAHDVPAIQSLFNDHYGEYLKGLGGDDFRDKVLAYIEKEDTPRSVNFQMNLMKQVGFKQVELLHKNGLFATFGAIK